MMKRLLLVLSVGVVFACVASAQRPPMPPAPASPPAPHISPAAPLAPEAFGDIERHFSIINPDGNYLGIRVANLSAEDRARLKLPPAMSGALVTEVTTDSPAARSGLREDDVILRFDDEAVTSASKLTRLISEAAPESSLRLSVYRAGSEQSLTATLGRRDGVARLLGEHFRNLPVPVAPADVERSLRGLRGLSERQGELAPVLFGSTRRLGISTVPLTRQLADYFDVKNGRGLLVTNVAADTPAARAGLKAGDVVIEIGAAQIDSTADFTRELNRKQEGEVELRVVRGGRERTIKAMPERSRDFQFNFEGFAPDALFESDARVPRRITPPAPPRPVLAPRLPIGKIL